MSSDYLAVIYKYEKDRETSAVEKLCFTTSQTGGIKTEIKSLKLFELTQARLNSRYIFLLYALKSSEIGQFAYIKLAYLMWVTFNISATMTCRAAESRSALFVATKRLYQ